MPTYQLTWVETKRHCAFAQAETESAARQAWIDHDYLGEFEWRADNQLLNVDELPGPHDKLCCCPTCEGRT